MKIRFSVFDFTAGAPKNNNDYLSSLAALYQVDPATLRERIEKAQLSLGEIKFIWNCSQ